MKLTPHLSAAASVVSLLCGTASLAANDPFIAPGVPVQGADGEMVGTVEETRGEAVVVNTGNHRALITIRSIERAGESLTINATKDDIDQMIDRQRREEAARRDEFLAPGRLVRSVDSEPVGRIVAIEREADSVVILRNEGVIALKQDHFAVIDNRLVALFTREQIDENTKPVPEVVRQRLAGLSGR
ncbi:hypothetical protein [Erythrobacter sp.]|uniref:hypothetical protein n=1 Tax=Erythrobacter sp. TaxID=1042 RepID=UPI0025E70221|nr:hypothetical protein [Erythrobacter sp.]